MGPGFPPMLDGQGSQFQDQPASQVPLPFILQSSYSAKKFGILLFLKGPKHEIFGSGVFIQIRPVWVGDSGTRPKNPKWLRLEIAVLYFYRYLLADIAKKSRQ
jgi:hypothetical protein